MRSQLVVLAFLYVALAGFARACADESAPVAPPSLAEHPLNRWVKLSPLAGRPASPRLGYEGACVWDSRHRLLVRYGGHNQGGGGEQGAEVWTFDVATARWTLKEPDTSPPGVCCNAQNVYAPTTERYVRFPLFSGSHGWQWSRELYLNDSSVWTYDLDENRWRNMRPLPAPRLAPYRCASWDSHRRVVVVFGGEGSSEGTLLYDPARNEWTWPKPPTEPAPRSGGSMAYDEARRLHVLFGSQFDDDRHTWAYDAAKNEWRDMQPAEQPPTAQNDPVLTYDARQRAVVAIVKITTGKDEAARHELQTWTYDAGENRWTRRAPDVEPDATGNRARQLVFAPELNLAILENCTSKPREQQIWTYRLGAGAVEGPPPAVARAAGDLVEDASATVLHAREVHLRWQAPRGRANVAGYLVERATVETWSDDQLRRLKSRTPPLAEPVVGAIRKIGPFTTLTDQPLPRLEFVDTSLDLDRPATVVGTPTYDRELHAEHLDRDGRAYRRAVYAYRIRWVDAQGAASGPSPPVFTIPASPRHVFSREDGTACDLKWEANPAAKLSGYRVYRMDGRYEKDPVTRLTETPLTGNTFRDENAGKQARRYYVVAVDALGQEGFPSSPTWFQREWRDFYRPFVGEWHQ